jgi:hypothetical protein
MRFINSYYDYSPIDLAKFADAHSRSVSTGAPWRIAGCARVRVAVAWR